MLIIYLTTLNLSETVQSHVALWADVWMWNI